MPAEVLLDGETVMSDRYAEVTGVPHDAPSQAVLHTQCTALIGIASLPVDPLQLLSLATSKFLYVTATAISSSRHESA